MNIGLQSMAAPPAPKAGGRGSNCRDANSEAPTVSTQFPRGHHIEFRTRVFRPASGLSLIPRARATQGTQTEMTVGEGANSE